MTSRNLSESPALLTLYSFPDGSFSGVASMRRGVRNPERLAAPSPWSQLDDDERTAANLMRSSRRAAVELRRKIRTADCRRLLTFTNGAPGHGWESLREAVHEVLAWYTETGHSLLGRTAFIVVAERGSRGGRVHVHAAIRAGYRLNYSQVIRSWSAFMESRGWHSPTGTHRWHAGDEHGKGKEAFSSARVCADYMSKYLSKGFDTDGRQLHEKRYRAAGVTVPEPDRWTGGRLCEVPLLLLDTFDGARVQMDWYESPDGDYGGWWVEIAPPS